MESVSPLKGALIGCGFVSQYHLEAWKKVEAAQIVGCCDINAVRLQEALFRMPGAKGFLDADELFRSMRLDFIEICTRPETHRSLVELAAKHGVHVLCQKPAAPDRPDFVAMIEACERADVQLMIHENWRFRPWYRAMRDELDRGSIGRPIRLRLNHRDTRALRPDGFRDQPYFKDMPRLILYEMGPHLVDTARFLLGEIQDVSARLATYGAGHLGEDVAVLTVAFESGAIGLLDMSWCSLADISRPEWALNETVIEGTSGTLSLDADGFIRKKDHAGVSVTLGVDLPGPQAIYLDGYVQTQAHFIDKLIHRALPESSGRDNLKTMEVIWVAYESARLGRTLPTFE